MENKKQLSPEEKSLYFELQAGFGFTKHAGGFKATDKLIELCHIEEGKYVLEVGCGVGTTACYIAKRCGCRVVGVDTSERMIDRSNEKAKRKGVEDKVEFRVADAQNPPFEDALFDAVIGESVTAFVEDKQRAACEFVRVTKPGGYVGVNEVTWIKTPPPELVQYLSRTLGRAEFLTSNGWKELLESSGLTDVEVRTYKLKALNQFIDEMRQFDFREYTIAWYRFLTQSIKNPAFRRFAKEAIPTSTSIFKIFEYFGYGIYVGRK